MVVKSRRVEDVEVSDAGLDHYDQKDAVVKNKKKEILGALKNNLNNMNGIDKVQLALDIAGFEPTVGSFADATNVVISTLRAAKSGLSGEGSQAKRHIFNAAISAVSLIPFADVVKILKLRKTPKMAKNIIRGARFAKIYAKREIVKSKFSPNETRFNDQSDPQENPAQLALYESNGGIQLSKEDGEKEVRAIEAKKKNTSVNTSNVKYEELAEVEE